MKELLLSLMFTSAFVACIVAFMLLLAYKLGIVEWLQVHGDKFTSKLAQCNFCMSFWMSMLFMFVIVAVTDDAHLMAIPLISTPIARMMV